MLVSETLDELGGDAATVLDLRDFEFEEVEVEIFVA